MFRLNACVLCVDLILLFTDDAGKVGAVAKTFEVAVVSLSHGWTVSHTAVSLRIKAHLILNRGTAACVTSQCASRKRPSHRDAN